MVENSHAQRLAQIKAKEKKINQDSTNSNLNCVVITRGLIVTNA